MKILVACEFSGVVRDEFAKLGHEVWSCDLLPTEQPGNHIQDDVLKYLNEGWDLMIAHPPCTYLTLAGNKWYKEEYRDRFPTREQDREDAVSFFMSLVNAPIPKICIENPVGIMSSRYQKPMQYIQPFEYGHPETKKTGLWLKGLPKLKPTNIVEPKFIICKGKRYSETHYYHRGKTKLEQSSIRSKTYNGIAEAMALQWGMEEMDI